MKAVRRPFLHVDLGDFAKIDEVSGDYETRFIWETFVAMDVQAVAVGPRELSLWSTFSDLIERGGIPVVSSNVTVLAGGKEGPVGEPFRIVTVNGLKVALFSVMGGGQFATVPMPEAATLNFQDPLRAASDLVPKLRQQADIVVLMSQMEPSDTQRLIEAVPGIDIALYGQRPAYREEPERVGRTIVNQTGTRGQYLGELILIVDPNGEIIDYGARNIPVDKAIPERADLAGRIAEVTEKVKEMRQVARERRQAERDQRMTGDRYLGVDNCKRCHEEQYRQWESSPHAHAFASLDRPVEGKPKGQECLACHVTGWGESGGFQPDPSRPDFLPAAKPNLANVQCESCHFKGTEHARTGKVEMAESMCRGCHTPEWSPNFDFESAIAAVRH